MIAVRGGLCEAVAYSLGRTHWYRSGPAASLSVRTAVSVQQLLKQETAQRGEQEMHAITQTADNALHYLS